jgi:hypothetical protein
MLKLSHYSTAIVAGAPPCYAFGLFCGMAAIGAISVNSGAKQLSRLFTIL